PNDAASCRCDRSSAGPAASRIRARTTSAGSRRRRLARLRLRSACRLRRRRAHLRSRAVLVTGGAACCLRRKTPARPDPMLAPGTSAETVGSATRRTRRGRRRRCRQRERLDGAASWKCARSRAVYLTIFAATTAGPASESWPQLVARQDGATIGGVAHVLELVEAGHDVVDALRKQAAGSAQVGECLGGQDRRLAGKVGVEVERELVGSDAAVRARLENQLFHQHQV